MNSHEQTAFQHWFAGSKIVNDQYQPLVMHHGGHFKADEFTGFDTGLTDPENDLGAGFYFTSSRTDAERYDYNLDYEVPQVLDVYLAIKNPYIIGETPIPAGFTQEKGEAFRLAVEALGYDGFIDRTVTHKFAHEGYTPDAGVFHVVAFYPEQIKSATSFSLW